MKVNLLIDSPDNVRNGYLNIDPAAPPDDPAGRVAGEVCDLSPHVDDGEAEEIVAHEILDWFPWDAADQTLKHWLQKLKHGGRLVLSTLDLPEVAKGIRDGLLEFDKANNLIYGEQDQHWKFRKCSFGLTRIVEVLTNLGFKVTKKRIDDYRAFVTCERP